MRLSKVRATNFNSGDLVGEQARSKDGVFKQLK